MSDATTQSHVADSDTVVVRPRWLAPTSLVLAVVGLAISAYLTFEHLTQNATLACVGGSEGSSGCFQVTTSSYAYIFGIPVAYYGLAFFIGMTALCLPQVWRRPERWIDQVRFWSLFVGLGMVGYLVWTELFRVKAICTWCSIVHVITIALFAVVAFGQIFTERESH